MPLSGRNAALKITGLAGVASTDNAATLSGDFLTVSINSTLRKHWDPDQSPEPSVWLNASTVGVGPYTVNYVQGQFEFTSTQNSSGVWTIDTDYLTASAVAGGREWQLNVEQEAFEVTEFGSGGWKQFQPNFAGASVSISRYWNDSDMLDRLASTGDNRFVVELVVSSANGWRYEGFARVASDNPQAAVDAIVSESANFVIDGELYFTT